MFNKDPSKASMKEDMWSSFPSSPLSHALDELNFETTIHTLTRGGSSSTPFERFSDVAGVESYIEDYSYGFKKVSEEPLPLSMEPFHQEKPACINEAGKIQEDFEWQWPFQECTEANPKHLQFDEATSSSLGIFSDKLGGEILIEDPYCFNPWSEGSLLLSETNMVHQEQPTYVDDEPRRIQDIQWPSKESRKVESNLLHIQHCHGSIAEAEVNKWQNHQEDCNSQLMPEPTHYVTQCEGFGEMGPASDLRAEKMLQYVSEVSEKQSFTGSVESASNSLRNVGSVNFQLVGRSPEDSILTPPAFHPVSKDSSDVTSLHDNSKLQPTSSGNAEEFDQPMPEKQMNTRPAITSYNDGYKRRCACKKTKCLKRYCACFAAGINCAEFCSCQACFNRPEPDYQDEIDYAKKKIKSSKPFASASKIQNATDIPMNNKEDFIPYGKKEDLLPADLHHNDVHNLSPLAPQLLDSCMSQLPPKNVSQLSPLTNPASMFGASRDWTHILPHGSGYLPPHNSSTPTTTMTRFGKITNQQCLESSNPVSFASNFVQNATDTPSSIMEDSKQGWTHTPH